MTSTGTGDLLSPESAGRLAEFARACKAAARVVALYPAAHPTIQAALARVADGERRLREDAAAVLTVLPDSVLLDGRAAARADAAIGELAALLHSHSIGELRIAASLTPGEWHTLLSLLARPPEEVHLEGGIAQAWVASGGGPVAIRQIDYAEVLREKQGETVEGGWDRIIASYLDGEVTDLDDHALGALFDIAVDGERFRSFTERLVARAAEGTLRGTKETILKLLQVLADYAAREHPEQLDRVLKNMADAVPRLTPDLVVTLITAGAPMGPGYAGIDLPGEVRARISDRTVGEFVAQSVARDGGATARLAEAFQALVPDGDRRRDLLELARREAEALPIGGQPGFPEIWQSAAELLTSYSDSRYVSDEYGRELSTARSHAIEVERVSDDPPERVSSWLATVSDDQVPRLDHQVLLDLLAIETRPEARVKVLESAVADIEQQVVAGNIRFAYALLQRVAAAAANGGAFAEPARAGLERLRSAPLMKHVVLLIRQARDTELETVREFCRTLGPEAIRPLADALVSEQGPAVRRLRDVLLSFGAAGRAFANELRTSPNPAVRRTAVDLLREFGGAEALPDLAVLVDDAEPAIQRDAVRAIVQIGTPDAYATLSQALQRGTPARREAIMQALTTQRETRAAPLFLYILQHTPSSGGFERVYLSALDALSRTSAEPDAVAALKAALYRGQWLAPRRTARLRAAAAAALRAMPSPEAQQALEDAARSGPRGVKRAARAALSAPPPRIPPRRTT